MPRTNRTALLIRCSVEQAQQIREAARREHRTLSGFVLNCLDYKLRIQAAVKEKMYRRNERPGDLTPANEGPKKD